MLGPKDDFHTLSNGKKIFSEITAILFLCFSVFVLNISRKKLKAKVTNKMIFQIIKSEILDCINVILAIFYD